MLVNDFCIYYSLREWLINSLNSGNHRKYLHGVITVWTQDGIFSVTAGAEYSKHCLLNGWELGFAVINSRPAHCFSEFLTEKPTPHSTVCKEFLAFMWIAGTSRFNVES